MPRQKKKKGEMADGSFDISDVPESSEDLEGAIADAFGDEESPGPAPDDDLEDVREDADEEYLEGAPPGTRAGSDEETARLRHERDEAIEGRKRAMADFVNYRRRADENEIRARQEGVASVVRSLMPMLDHLDLALDQEETEMTTEQLLEGVRMVYDALTRALESHLVRVIAPEIGSDFDPNEHQAVLRACTDEQPPNTIAAVLQVGYAVNDIVLRPASVSVAAPAEAGD